MASIGSGTKKRTKMFSGGNSDTTGPPAGIVSPARASTSATTPAAGAATWRWSSRHCAIATAARAASTARLLGLDFVARARVGFAHLRQRGFEPLHLGARGSQVGALLFDDLHRGRARLEQAFRWR